MGEKGRAGTWTRKVERDFKKDFHSRDFHKEGRAATWRRMVERGHEKEGGAGHGQGRKSRDMEDEGRAETWGKR